MEKAKYFLIVLNVAMAVFMIGYFLMNSGPDLRPRNNWQWQDEWPKTPESPQQPESSPEQPVKPQTQVRTTNLSEGKSLAEQNRMNMMVSFHADWCGPCKQMQSTTFKDEKVKEALKKYVLVDLNSDQNKAAVKEFEVEGLPTNIIAHSDGRVVDKVVGFKDAAAFSEWLD